jgi:hypothetical protein
MWSSFSWNLWGFSLTKGEGFAYWQSPKGGSAPHHPSKDCLKDLDSHLSCSMPVDRKQVGSRGQHPSVRALSESYTDGSGDLCVKSLRCDQKCQATLRADELNGWEHPPLWQHFLAYARSLHYQFFLQCRVRFLEVFNPCFDCMGRRHNHYVEY